MSASTRLRRELLALLRTDYGVTDAAIEAGGSHYRCRFSRDGRSHAIIYPYSPTDEWQVVLERKRRELRRLLGAPPQPRAIAPVTSEEEPMPTLEARSTASSDATPKPKRRTHRGKDKTPEHYRRCEEVRARLGMSPAEFSIALGYNTTGGYQASTKGEIAPLTLALAAEGVLGRYGTPEPTGNAPDRYLLLTVSATGAVTSRPVASIERLSVGGRSYLLIPEVDPAARAG